ncbi:MAG: tripartite tricarboxylate transporter permease [Rhodocyclaceae bacterium]|nr:tripartite tricarboxylate transporter permease [Rhodocyclaceae bacterium]
MDLLSHLTLGFSVALSVQNLLYCLIGALIGTLVGVLPGLGPVATIALLLPLTYGLEPASAIIMLAGIYYGAQYGGSTTSILLKLPGEVSSVVTALDGHEMARRGRAGQALRVAALGSFLAGCSATLLVAAVAPGLTALALSFAPADHAALIALGLVASVTLARGSIAKSVATALMGMLFGLVGTDLTSGRERYAFGVAELSDGIDFVAVAMGLFGVAEIVRNLEPGGSAGVQLQDAGSPATSRLSREEWQLAWPACLRGTALGALLGVLPGGGAVLGAFASYMLEKKIARAPERFGQGAIEGVAGPESANNAGAQTAFIPMLTLGLPSNGVMALMLGALTLHGIQPGPQIMTADPRLFWGLVASMWVGNVFLLILNLPLIALWVRLLALRYALLYPAVLVLCAAGAYSVGNSYATVIMMAGFGLLGYLFVRLDCEPTPFVLGFVLGPMLEENLRRAMTLSHGDFGVFLSQPWSATFLALAALMLALTAIPALARARQVAFSEGG